MPRRAPPRALRRDPGRGRVRPRARRRRPPAAQGCCGSPTSPPTPPRWTSPSTRWAAPPTDPCCAGSGLRRRSPATGSCAPGRYAVAVRAAGAAASTPPVLAATVELGGGARPTVRWRRLLRRPRGCRCWPTTSRPRRPAGPACGCWRRRLGRPGRRLPRRGHPRGRGLPFADTQWLRRRARPGDQRCSVVPARRRRADAAGDPRRRVRVQRGRPRPGRGRPHRAHGAGRRGPAAVPVGGVETGAGGTARRRRGRLRVCRARRSAPLAARRSPAPGPRRGGARGSRRLSSRSCRRPVRRLGRSPCRPVAFAGGAGRPAAAPAVPVRVRSRRRRRQQPGPARADASGALVPPADFAQAGWFAGGPAPGRRRPGGASPATWTRSAGRPCSSGSRAAAQRRRRAGQPGRRDDAALHGHPRGALSEVGVPDRRGLRPDGRCRAAADHLRRPLRLRPAQLRRRRRRLRATDAG